MIRVGNHSKVICIILIILMTYSCRSTLFISDGAVFESKDYFPEFNWNTTPMYYMFGDIDKLLSQDEVSFIAKRTNFLCIEKSHGFKLLGAAELGAKHERIAFKKKNDGIKVLFYFNSAWAWPFTSFNKNFIRKDIEAYPELKKYLVMNPETGELNHRRDILGFDVLNPEFRDWWVTSVVEGVNISGCDGAFIDQMHGFFYLREDRKEEVLKAMGVMLGELKNRMGPDKILLANNANDEIAKYVYPYIDASMFEHYSSKLTTKENLLKEWNDMLKNAKQGKMSIFRFGFEHDIDKSDLTNKKAYAAEMERLSKENLEFYLASYLIGAQPYSYFQYGWGWNLADGSLVDHPDLLKPLGAPKGAYKRTIPEGWEFTREFEHASIWLNTESRESKITWR